MQNEVTFVIDQSTGTGVFLLTEAAKTLDFGPLPKIRASHVLPANVFLRAVFNLIRSCCTDTSRVAAWTRRWACEWIVDTSPLGGGILEGRWRDRIKAIDAEVEAINQIFIEGL
jgi:hypothetical protein